MTTPINADSLVWFENNTPLTQAHRHLLEQDLSSMFASLVEVWQQNESESVGNHLNDLLLQSLQADCGKSLNGEMLPDWISNTTVRRIRLQSPGRDTYRVVLETEAHKELKDITLTRWVSKTISSDDQFIKEPTSGGAQKYTKRYNLNHTLAKGLYRLEITASDQSTWSSWVILGEEKPNHTVRWIDNENWVIDKTSLLNPHCPLPKLDVALFDYIDSDYKQVWQRSYDSNYPTSLDDSTNIQAGRYILAVSMKQKRWQGPLIVEESQIISRTYDVSVEE